MAFTKARVFDIPSTIDYYLSPDLEVEQRFGMDKFGSAPQSDHFAILSNEGALKRGDPVKTDYYAVILCLRGTCTKTVGHFTFQVTPHSLHFVSPRFISSYEDASDDLLVYMIFFKRDFLEDSFIDGAVLDSLLDDHVDHPPFMDLNEQSFNSIRVLMEAIDREYKEARAFHKNMVKLQLVQLMYEMHRTCDVPLHHGERPVNRQYYIVQQYKKLVEEHFIYKRTVQEYAELLNVSAKHLSELVKNETGHSALHVLHQRLFLEAQHLLSYSALSIKEVADQLNFDTSSHFSRFFKQYAGYNPSGFKKIV